ncbi:hypothetical protein [Novosphingobium fuchskuhlense]|uniref:8-oxoguanine DNA glycosylase OGG fold protein n=1 Tax=Novosphingobium fuchskuhlense TaxID=1117702 RepID=UPI000B01A9BB|nr:hypothetical protein [Novosphingobium fuchskuhlense]
MSFAINQQHYGQFLTLAHQTGWPAARKPASWAKRVGAETHLVDLLSDKQVERNYLKEICANSSVSDEACFLAIMAWGGMKYDHGRTAWGLREKWSPIIADIREGRLSRVQAYECFRKFRISNPRCGFGPAYYTKLIFFASSEHDGYIMDQWTSVSANLLLSYNSHPIVDLTAATSRGQTSHSVSDRNAEDVYETFCKGIEFLASQDDLRQGLGITSAEEVEMRMFSYGGRHPAAWRQYIKRQPQPPKRYL